MNATENRTNTELVEASIAGDEIAFDQLIRRVQPLVYRRVASFPFSEAEQKDITQIVLLQAFRKLDSLRDKEKFEAWIGRIAYNVARQSCRKREQQLCFEEFFDESHAFPAEDTLNNSLHTDLDLKVGLRSAFHRLSQHHQEVLWHHYYQGRNYSETAMLLEVEVNTVRSRLQKARNSIRKLLSTMTHSQSDPNILEIEPGFLSELTSASTFCSEDPERQKLHGVFLDPNGRIVSTDGRQLYHRQFSSVKGLEKSATLNLKKNGNEPAYSKSESGTLFLGVDEAILKVPGRDDVSFEMIQDNFPPYEQVIPTAWNLRCLVSSKDLNDTLTILRSHLQPKHPDIEGWEYMPIVTLSIFKDDGKILFSTDSTQGYSQESSTDNNDDTTVKEEPPVPGIYWQFSCEAKAAINISNEWDSEQTVMRIAFNANFLGKAVTAMNTSGSDEIELSFQSEKQALVMTCPGTNNATVITMPVRL